MVTARVLLAIGVAGCWANLAEASGVEYRKNPIRKVVTMLEDMQKGVEEEGEKEEELFESFMCYCKNGAGALDTSISAGKAQIDQLTSTVQRGTSEKSQLEQDITQHKADREEAEKVSKESTAMREKEAAEFAAASGEAKSNIQSLTTALAALKKGLSASLLQTGVGQTIRNVIRTSPLVGDDQRDVLMSFLESGSDMEGGSDQIIGIMEQMLETMQGDLKESEDKEAEALATYQSLMTSKSSEIAAATQAIETKMSRSGQVAVETVQAKADLQSTEKAVAADTEFRANMAKDCARKQKEYDEKNKLRAQEIEAISEVIKMLSSDDALELFKKTAPSASLLQVSSRSRVRLHSRLHKANSRSPMLLALRSGTRGFEKVVGMVDGMVTVLEGEQGGDDKMDVWCKEELEKAEGEATALKSEISDLEATLEEQKDGIESVAAEIEALKTGLVELDKSVAEATEQRKKEHAESLETAAANQAAVELLGMAKNRMNKFYNPTLYKEPEKKEEDLLQYKKSEGSAGVIQMLDEMIKDVEADMAEGKSDEEESQKDYVSDMDDAAIKRADDSKLVVTKEAEKAEKVGKQEDGKELKRTKGQQADVLEEQIKNLHKTCDFLLEQYAKIKEERTKEEEGLKASKMVLSGAKLEFLQHA
jgi:chromosome segregation ATPase